MRSGASCKQFTPLLKQFYEKAKAGGEKIEIIFVSNDKSEAEMRSYFQNHHGDYLTVKYGDDAPRSASQLKYKVYLQLR